MLSRNGLPESRVSRQVVSASETAVCMWLPEVRDISVAARTMDMAWARRSFTRDWRLAAFEVESSRQLLPTLPLAVGSSWR